MATYFMDVFHLARVLNNIEFSILEFNVNNNGIIFPSQLNGASAKNQHKEKQFNQIDKINKSIKQFNAILDKKFLFLQCRKLQVLRKAEYAEIIDAHVDSSSISRNHTMMKVKVYLTKLTNDIKRFLEDLHKIPEPFGPANKKWKLRENSFKTFNEIMGVYSLGYFNTAVFVSGKFLEKEVNDYLFLLKKTKMIDKTYEEINKWDFDTKINVLHSKGFINKRDYAKILSVKEDRNIFAHPSSKSKIKLAQDDADATIRVALNQMQILESKIAKLHKDYYGKEPR